MRVNIPKTSVDSIKSKNLLLKHFQIRDVVEISVIGVVEGFLGLIYQFGSRIHMCSTYFQVRREAVATSVLCCEEEVRTSQRTNT